MFLNKNDVIETLDYTLEHIRSLYKNTIFTKTLNYLTVKILKS